jgi:hypothetical protein
MKKYVTFFTIVLFSGVLAFSALAFTDGDPKKNKTACDSITAATTACSKHDSTAHCAKMSGADKNMPCTKHKEETADIEAKEACPEKTATGECPKAATCKKHKETAEKN